MLMNKRRCRDDELSDFFAVFDDPTIPWWQKVLMAAFGMGILGLLALLVYGLSLTVV